MIHEQFTRPFGRVYAARRAVARTILIGGTATCLIAAAPAGAHAAVTLSPLPGTPDASPQTQVSILGAKRKQIKSVSVTGSVTGNHAGSLESYKARTGASFVPDEPFAEGENVTAKVTFKGGKAKTKFTVMTAPPFVAPFLDASQRQPDQLQHFNSEPDLVPPQITVKKADPKSDDGSVFLTPLPSPTVHPGGGSVIGINPVGPGGPMIIDGAGNLVYFKQLPASVEAANLRVQRYQGKKVLTWWEGRVRGWAYGEGDDVIANHHYKEIERFSAGNGYSADLHEFTLTPKGDALIEAYSPVCVTPVCNPLDADENNWPLMDAVIQLVDPQTGLVEWEWHALGHIDVADSTVIPASHVFDAFHVNSIQSLKHGKILASLRDTSAIYKIDRSSGKINWTLGGSNSDFKMGRGAKFNFQHDAQMLSNKRVSLFDDAGGPPVYDPGYSRGLVLDLNKKKGKATVKQEYARNKKTLADSEGSVQKLNGGDRFVGFGSTPFFSQFTKDGKKVFDAAQPADNGSYRVYRFPWTATPKSDPAIAVTPGPHGHAIVYASWNGATKVAKWSVRAGTSVDSLKKIGAAKSTGFETAIDVLGDNALYAVRALDKHGRVLAESPARPITP